MSQIEVLTEGPRGVTIYLSETVLGIVLAAWATTRGAAALRDPRLRPVLLGVGAVGASLAASCLVAPDPGVALRATFRWCEFLGVLLIAADGALRGVFTRRLLVGCLAAAVVLLAVHALWDAQPWVARVYDADARPGVRVGTGEVVWRAGGFIHPNALAALLAVAAAVCATGALSARSALAAGAAGAATALAVATIVLTYSRGGLLWLAAIAIALGVAARRAPRPRAGLVRAAAIAAVAALLIRGLSLPQALGVQTTAVRETAARLADWLKPTVRSSALPLGTQSVQSEMAVRGVDERKQMAEAVGRLAAGHRLLGVGPGGYRRAIRDVAGEAMDLAAFAHHPHNLYLLVLAEQGAIGLLAWGVLLLGLLRTAAVPARLGWPHAAWAGAWGGVLGGFLLHSGFDVIVVHARGIPIAFLLGALLRTPGAGTTANTAARPTRPSRV